MYICILNQTHMNKEQVKKIISDEIVNQLTNMIEEMSTDEFIDKLCDRIYTETGFDVDGEDMRDEVTDMVGEKIYPFIQTMSTYFLDNFVKTEK